MGPALPPTHGTPVTLRFHPYYLLPTPSARTHARKAPLVLSNIYIYIYIYIYISAAELAVCHYASRAPIKLLLLSTDAQGEKPRIQQDPSSFLSPCKPKPPVYASSTEALPIDDNSHLFLLLTCVHLSQEPYSGPRQALSHLYMPVQESVPETGSSLRAEGEPGGQSSPGECTVHQMKEAGKAHLPWLLIHHYQQGKSCWV